MCDVIREQNDAIATSIESLEKKLTTAEKAEAVIRVTRKATYEAKFKLLRQQAFDIAAELNASGDTEAHDAAYKAVFHLNPRIAIDTAIPTTKKSDFMSRLLSVFPGSLITNQIIWIPGLLEDMCKLPEEELSGSYLSEEEGFCREWCKT